MQKILVNSRHFFEFSIQKFFPKPFLFFDCLNTMFFFLQLFDDFLLEPLLEDDFDLFSDIMNSIILHELQLNHTYQKSGDLSIMYRWIVDILRRIIDIHFLEEDFRCFGILGSLWDYNQFSLSLSSSLRKYVHCTPFLSLQQCKRCKSFVGGLISISYQITRFKLGFFNSFA